MQRYGRWARVVQALPRAWPARGRTGVSHGCRFAVGVGARPAGPAAVPPRSGRGSAVPPEAVPAFTGRTSRACAAARMSLAPTKSTKPRPAGSATASPPSPERLLPAATCGCASPARWRTNGRRPPRGTSPGTTDPPPRGCPATAAGAGCAPSPPGPPLRRPGERGHRRHRGRNRGLRLRRHDRGRHRPPPHDGGPPRLRAHRARHRQRAAVGHGRGPRGRRRRGRRLHPGRPPGRPLPVPRPGAAHTGTCTVARRTTAALQRPAATW
ncbi:hypothetical protein SGRIM128S_06471 [Streptomyces griseomycini]